MDTQSNSHLPHAKDEGRIGLLGVFASPGVEGAFQRQHFRDDLWLGRFLVAAGMIRVALLLLADYQHLGMGTAFWLLFVSRLLFLLTPAPSTYQDNQ